MTDCSWGSCKKIVKFPSGIPLCTEHYLAKEAQYGIYDLTHDDHYADEYTRESVREIGIKRVIEYAEFMMEKK